MADTFYGRMKIYGKFDKELIEGLLEAVEKDAPDMATKPGHGEGNPYSQFLLEDIRDKGYIEIDDTKAELGEFRNIEDFCEKNGIPYVRESKPYAGYNGERFVFNAYGDCTTQTCHINNQGNPVVEVKEVLKFTNDTNEPHEVLNKIISFIESNNPQMPKELQKVTLTDDAFSFLRDRFQDDILDTPYF